MKHHSSPESAPAVPLSAALPSGWETYKRRLLSILSSCRIVHETAARQERWQRKQANGPTGDGRRGPASGERRGSSENVRFTLSDRSGAAPIAGAAGPEIK